MTAADQGAAGFLRARQTDEASDGSAPHRSRWRIRDLHAVEIADEGRLVGHLGPDVLGPDWDPAEAARRLQAAPTTIGAALLDQRNLAGVGTLYAAETLAEQKARGQVAAKVLDGQLDLI